MIVAPFVSLLYLIYTRVVLEVIIALFRIMETNVELVQLQRAASSGPGSPVDSASAAPPPASDAPAGAGAGGAATEPDGAAALEVNPAGWGSGCPPAAGCRAHTSADVGQSCEPASE